MPAGQFEVGGLVMTAECIHYWLIEPANGPTSNGICKECKEKKSFTNTEPYYLGRLDWSKIAIGKKKRTDLGS